MFRSVLTKFCLRHRSSKKAKPMNEPSAPVSAAKDLYDKVIDFPISELSANQMANKMSLSVSPETLPRDQWVGQKYFEFFMARCLTRETSMQKGIFSLEVCLASLHTRK